MPNFWNRQQWYDIHFLKGRDRKEQFSYESQLGWTARLFKAINLPAQKKTHLRRSQGAKQAELDGVGESQIRRAGQWNRDALTNCYLAQLPRKFLRVQAQRDGGVLPAPGPYGFHTKESHFY